MQHLRHQVKRNVWVARQRPKRLPKDDIPVCSCRPPAAAAALPSAPAAAPLAQPPVSMPPTLGSSLPQQLAAPFLEAGNAALSVVAPPLLLTPQEPLPASPAVAFSRADSAPPDLAAAMQGHAALQLGPPLAPQQLQSLQHNGHANGGLANGGSASSASEGAAAAASAPLDLAHAADEGGSEGAATVPAAEGAAALSDVSREAVVGALGPRPASAMPKLQPAERLGCGENCLNRLSYIHCDPRLCPCADLCGNRCCSFLSLVLLCC